VFLCCVLHRQHLHMHCRSAAHAPGARDHLITTTSSGSSSSSSKNTSGGRSQRVSVQLAASTLVDQQHCSKTLSWFRTTSLTNCLL
jgi:hypothetical protein